MTANVMMGGGMGSNGGGGGGYMTDYNFSRGSYPAFGNELRGGGGGGMSSAAFTGGGHIGLAQSEDGLYHGHDTVSGISTPRTPSSLQFHAPYRSQQALQSDSSIIGPFLKTFDNGQGPALASLGFNSGTNDLKPRGTKRTSVIHGREDEGTSNEEDNGDDASVSQKSINPSRRAAQNRQAQKAFRQRREKYVKDLEDKAVIFETIQIELDGLKKENALLKEALSRQQEVILQFERERGVTPHPKEQTSELTSRPIPSSMEVSPVAIVPAKRRSHELSDEGSQDRSQTPHHESESRPISTERSAPPTMRGEDQAFLRSIASSLSNPMGGMYPPDLVVAAFESWIRKSLKSPQDMTPRSTRASTPVPEWSRQAVICTALEAVKIAADETACNEMHPFVDLKVLPSGGSRARMNEIARQESFKVNEKCRNMSAQVLNAFERNLITPRMYRLIWWQGVAAKAYAYFDISVPKPKANKTELFERANTFVMPAPPHCCCPNRNGKPLIRLGRSGEDNLTRRLPSIALAQYIPPPRHSPSRLSPSDSLNCHNLRNRASSTSPLIRNGKVLGSSPHDISCDPGPYGTTEAELANNPPIGRPALRLDNICHPAPDTSQYPTSLDYIEVARDYLQFHRMALDILEVEMQDKVIPIFEESAVISDQEKILVLFLYAEEAFANGEYEIALARYEILLNEGDMTSEGNGEKLYLQMIRLKLMIAMCLMALNRDPRTILYSILDDVSNGKILSLSMHEGCKLPPPKLPTHQDMEPTCRIAPLKHETFVEYETKAIPQFVVCLLVRYFKNCLEASDVGQINNLVNSADAVEYLTLCQMDWSHASEAHLPMILQKSQFLDLRTAVPFIHDQDLLAVLLGLNMPFSDSGKLYAHDEETIRIAKIQSDRISNASKRPKQLKETGSMTSDGRPLASANALADELFQEFLSHICHRYDWPTSQYTTDGNDIEDDDAGKDISSDQKKIAPADHMLQEPPPEQDVHHSNGSSISKGFGSKKAKIAYASSTQSSSSSARPRHGLQTTPSFIGIRSTLRKKGEGDPISGYYM